MKKVLAIFTVIAILSFSSMAFAHGGGGGYGSHMGAGSGMMGYGGYDNSHMGYGNSHMGYDGHGYDKEFLDKTVDLRKEFHEKRFEYMEAYRAGDEKKAKKLAKELDELSEKLYDAAPKGTFNGRGGNDRYRNCW